jgi:TonB family protein
VFLFFALAGARAVSQAGNSHLPSDEITVVSLSPPVYPQAARIASIVGDVRIAVTLRPDGTVESVKPVSGHPVLMQAALDSARQTRFACGRCTETETYEMLYSFKIVDGDNCCDSINAPATIDVTAQSSGSDGKRVTEVVVKAQRVCLCDPAVKLTTKKVRSAKCLYLWKCTSRKISHGSEGEHIVATKVGSGSFFDVVAKGGVQTQSPITICDLVRNPQKYNDQKVTVRATWRYGFEWSQLYCLDCLDMGKAWLDRSSDLDEASERALKKIPKGAGIVNLTVEGVFRSDGTFGHLNGYRYEIVPSRISNISVIQKGAKSPAEDQKAERRWACGGANPK